jgi:cation transport protein ChaC
MEPPLWVFGYGSLIWDPGFPVVARQAARLNGWQRGFCMKSIHHRGTPEAPGLVLALDRAAGAVCHGVALAVTPGAEAATLDALRARELVSSAYLEAWLPVRLANGRRARALAYVVDRAHAQYCGRLPVAEQARIIAAAAGGRGRNADYLFHTVAHLDALGLADPALSDLAARVREIGDSAGR